MKVILLDARNLLFRQGFACRNLSNSEGVWTGALYGTAGLLLRLKKHLPEARFAAVWDGEDAHREGWRPRIDPAYKNNRERPQLETEEKRMREQVLSQIPLLKDLFYNLGVPQLEVRGVEADDGLAIYALELRSRGVSPIIYSSDKDFCQLLPRGVAVIRDVDKKIKFRLEDEETVRHYFNCGVGEIARMRAYLGDPSDGLPSACFNVGPVTAAKYLAMGADPSVAAFHLLPEQVQQGAAKLRSGWPRLHTNYRVMQLLEKVEDARLSAYQQKEMKEGIRKCQQMLAARPVFDQERYHGLVKFLAAYELREAMRDRQSLLRIQELEKRIA